MEQEASVPRTDSDHEEIGRIHWDYTDGSLMVYNLEVVKMDTFMPASNFTGAKRTFKGPDGRSYAWKMGLSSCSLDVTGDTSVKSRTVVHVRPNITAKRAKMEVDDEVLPMLDLIIITWVFMEQRRYGRVY
ncbi:hypothetical protein NM688_g7401 [Phlebia brevispora]|uniref:Uncharacterized protein n=1 Tax=Phlebia brevispora TaxID=194682 RepID=A0ACC1S5Q2_9APHY|nr:hypothetical protein NM688_g7401 [Phlebia brevispora]